MRPRIRWRAATGAVAAAAPGRPARTPGGPAGAGTAPAALGFGWLRPGAVPAGWRRAALPGQPAVLAYPGWLRPQPGDAGTVTVAFGSRAGTVLAYLNVTPRQGSESLPGWPGFRLAHLRGDGDTAVRLDARSAEVAFRGGRGRCVMDDYTTRVHGNHYREIACFVQAAAGGSVLVAATPVSDWGTYGGVLERAVTAYRAG